MVHKDTYRRLGPELEKRFFSGCVDLRLDWAMNRGYAPREPLLALQAFSRKLKRGEKLNESEMLLMSYLAIAHLRDDWLEDILKEW